MEREHGNAEDRSWSGTGANDDKLYSGTSDNGLPVLRNPPQCGYKAAVSNHFL